MYRTPPPPPPILVGGRHHCHLSSAVTAPLVAGAVARQLQSLVSATITSGRNDNLLGRICRRRWPLSCFLHYLSPTTGTPTAAVTTALSSPPLPTHKHPDKRCNWTAADGRRHEMNGGGAIDRDAIGGKRRDRWMAAAAGGGDDGRRRASRWETATAGTISVGNQQQRRRN